MTDKTRTAPSTLIALFKILLLDLTDTISDGLRCRIAVFQGFHPDS